MATLSPRLSKDARIVVASFKSEFLFRYKRALTRNLAAHDA
jgi:hypothetical protein